MGKSVNITVKVEDKGLFELHQDGTPYAKAKLVRVEYAPGHNEPEVTGATYLPDGQYVKWVWPVGVRVPDVGGDVPVPPHQLGEASPLLEEAAPDVGDVSK